jgi:hypothetical protein
MEKLVQWKFGGRETRTKWQMVNLSFFKVNYFVCCIASETVVSNSNCSGSVIIIHDFAGLIKKKFKAPQAASV